MTNKRVLFNREVESSLKDLTQHYQIAFMEAEVDYPPKIDLVILLKSKLEGKNFAYRSLRFKTLRELELFIDDIENAKDFFQSQLTK